MTGGGNRSGGDLLSQSILERKKSVWRGVISEIDGLRGIAIFLVLLDHFWPSTGPLSAFWAYAKMGRIGVDLFFVISGFLICGILLDTRGDASFFRNFYARRTLRIFPLYYLFLFIVFTVIPLTQGGAYFQTPFLKASGSPAWYFTYMSNFAYVVVPGDRPYFLAPLWTLAIEEQFYICFPFLVSILNPNRLWKLLVGVIIGTLIFRIVTMFAYPEMGVAFQRVITPARVDGIAMGALLSLGFRMGKVRFTAKQSTIMLISMLVLAISAFHAGWLDYNRPYGRTIGFTIVPATFLSILLWTLLHRGQLMTAFLRFPPLAYLGKICYGSYVLHRVAESFLLKVLQQLGITADSGSGWLIIGKVLAAVSLASLSWFIFEQPILRLKDRFTSTHHPEYSESPAIKA
jgi:peptidoglycan/LPS O-acetylase OafA/YrhL